MSTLARSAPVKPGCLAGDHGQLAVGVGQAPALGVEAQDVEPALAVGLLDGDVAVEAARPQQGGVEDVDPVGGGQHGDALGGGEAVHLHEQLVEGLLPLVVAAAEAGAPLAAHGVELVDEHDGRAPARAWRNRSRTRAAPTPTRDSTNSEPEMEKKLALASPATARASRVLPQPGRADEEHALGRQGAHALEGRRLGQVVPDLGQLGDRLVGAGDVEEGGAPRPPSPSILSPTEPKSRKSSAPPALPRTR